jgi:hypothetical protein
LQRHLRRRVFRQPRGAYEVDHLIPLELGGDNVIANLWPEAAERHHFDTPHSKRTDFHSGRRGFVTGLATAGANEATSMALAHHHDSRVH